MFHLIKQKTKKRESDMCCWRETASQQCMNTCFQRHSIERLELLCSDRGI